METSLPQRRQNIRATEQRAGDDTIHIVLNEETDQYYRFAEVEFEIFSQFDGQTTLEKIKQDLQDNYNVEVPLEQIEKFVDDLKEKGLLEGSESKVLKRNTWKNLFYLRWKALNPEQLLNRLISPLSFIYTRSFVILALILIGWSFIYLYLQRVAWLKQGAVLFHGWGFLILYFSLLTIGFVHEMGHSLTCKHFGGRVKEMGFIFIYFMPGFYANVSDTYLFPDKYQRALVGAAGLFFQFIGSAFAMILLTFSIPGSLFANFLIGMIAMSGYEAFWNFNPLIKLDGYYILVDLLEVPNLRSGSFHYLSLLFQKWVLNVPEARHEIENTSPRLKRIFLGYGLLGICYTTFFLGLSIFWIIRFATRKMGGFGLILAGAGIGWIIWNWYKHAAPGITKFASDLKEKADLRLIVKSRFQKILLAAAAILILSLIPGRWGLKGSCEVRPAVRQAIAPLETGRVTRILKQAGEPVHAGELLAVLDNFNTRRELATLRIESQLKAERLTLLKAEYGSSLTDAQGHFAQSRLALQAHVLLSPHQIREARNAMEAALARYRKAETSQKTTKKEWDRYQVLAKEDLVSPKEAEEKESAYRNAYQEFVSAQNEYASASQAHQRISQQVTFTDPQKLRQDLDVSQKNLMFTKNKAVEINAAQSELDEVNSRIKTDEEKLSRLQITSPIDGVIMTPRMKEFLGKTVAEGQPIAWIYQPGPMIFEIRMNEMDISEVPRPTDDPNNVTLKILALPGKSFKGRVTRIVPESLTNPAGKSYLVDVAVNDQEGLLLPGMQGTAKIYGKTRLLLWQIIRRPVKFISWKLWSIF